MGKGDYAKVALEQSYKCYSVKVTLPLISKEVTLVIKTFEPKMVRKSSQKFGQNMQSKDCIRTKIIYPAFDALEQK